MAGCGVQGHEVRGWVWEGSGAAVRSDVAMGVRAEGVYVLKSLLKGFAPICYSDCLLVFVCLENAIIYQVKETIMDPVTNAIMLSVLARYYGLKESGYDLYLELIALIDCKYGIETNLKVAIENFEKEPNSVLNIKELRDAIQRNKVGDDREILQAANKLYDALEPTFRAGEASAKLYMRMKLFKEIEKGNTYGQRKTLEAPIFPDLLDKKARSIIEKIIEEKYALKEEHIKRILAFICKKNFKISVAHPRLITKRFESPFWVQIYFEELDADAKARIKGIIGEDASDHVYDTEIKFGQVIKIKLYSPDITFPEPISKQLDSPSTSMTFLGKPLDTCQPGEHKVVLSILDNKTNIEYQSETFSVKVVDFAFDHVSQPLLSRTFAIVLGIGSFAMFLLTFLEQIDKTIGLTSGTAAGVLAAIVYANFYSLYQRLHPSTP